MSPAVFLFLIEESQLQNQLIPSPRRKPGSRMHCKDWIPAFAGMTQKDFCNWLEEFESWE